MDMHALLIHLLRRSGATTFLCDKKAVGAFFFKAKQDRETQPLLESVVFHDSHGYPTAPEINDAIQRLQLTGVLGQPNPRQGVSAIQYKPHDWEAVEFNEALKDQFGILLVRFTQELCDVTREIAR